MCYTGIYKAGAAAGNHSRKKNPIQVCCAAPFRKCYARHIGAHPEGLCQAHWCPAGSCTRGCKFTRSPGAFFCVRVWGALAPPPPRFVIPSPAFGSAPVRGCPLPLPGWLGFCVLVWGALVSPPVAGRRPVWLWVLAAVGPGSRLALCLALPSGLWPCGRRLRLFRWWRYIKKIKPLTAALFHNA